jgi:hypothetical protein
MVSPILAISLLTDVGAAANDRSLVKDEIILPMTLIGEVILSAQARPTNLPSGNLRWVGYGMLV